MRFYERKGLIAQPAKPLDGGIRDYGCDMVARIRFIRHARDIGFSLHEIAQLLSLRADPRADCADVLGRAIEKRDQVQAKLDRLVRMRDALNELIASCPGGGDVSTGTILEAMEGEATMAGAEPDRPEGDQGNRCRKRQRVLDYRIHAMRAFFSRMVICAGMESYDPRPL